MEAETSEDITVYILAAHENREVPQEERQGEDVAHRIVVRAEKTLAGVEQLTITQPR